MVTNPLAYHTKMLIKQKACSSIVSSHALKFYKVQFTLAMFGVKNGRNSDTDITCRDFFGQCNSKPKHCMDKL